jgi:hypothetical protein
MARADQRERGIAPGPPPTLPGSLRPDDQPVVRRHVSTGHVVMIVTALVAALLTYSILRQAGGPGTTVIVAAQPIVQGEVATGSLFTTTTLKAQAGVVGQLVTPANESAVLGKPAAVAIAKGQVVQADQFASAPPEPPRMTILVSPDQVPGGLSTLVVGSRIDLLGTTAAGVPTMVPGLEVLQVPSQPSPGTLSDASTTVPIDVAVPSIAAAEYIYGVTSGKFGIRVSDPSPTSGVQPSPAANAPGAQG